MSVPVPKRSEGELAVNTKCRELVVYTLKILENEKWFPQNQQAFISKLQDCVIEIAAVCWEANNIKVSNVKDYNDRINLQRSAISKCNRMCMLIEIAKPLFHLNSKRVRYWIKLTIEARNMIHAWSDKDVQRLDPQPF